jgi:hypothetical protein
VLGLISVDEVARLISEEQVRPREETIHRTYYAVFVEDVDREYEELKREGVHFVKPPQCTHDHHDHRMRRSLSWVFLGLTLVQRWVLTVFPPC